RSKRSPSPQPELPAEPEPTGIAIVDAEPALELNPEPETGQETERAPELEPESGTGLFGWVFAKGTTPRDPSPGAEGTHDLAPESVSKPDGNMPEIEIIDEPPAELLDSEEENPFKDEPKRHRSRKYEQILGEESRERVKERSGSSKHRRHRDGSKEKERDKDRDKD